MLLSGEEGGLVGLIAGGSVGEGEGDFRRSSILRESGGKDVLFNRKGPDESKKASELGDPSFSPSNLRVRDRARLQGPVCKGELEERTSRSRICS
jgi:hypothetical protein